MTPADRPCPDCGSDASDVAGADLGERVRRSADLWGPLLAAPDAAQRSRPEGRSVLERARQVRDAHLAARERITGPGHDDPLVDKGHPEAPAQVASQVQRAAAAVATAYDAVPGDAWDRPDRSTDLAQGRRHLHEVEHHAWEVRDAVRALTVRAYDADADDYAAASPDLSDTVRARLDAFAAALGRGASVLEIGSGSGRDAVALEERGLRVRRTDVTPGFVTRLRAAGHDAEVLDPLTCDPAELLDRTDPAGRVGRAGLHDGVWANASLLHVDRADLPVVLRRLAAAVRPGGVLSLSVKRGDGSGWSTHGSVAAPRRFTYWQAEPLRDVVAGAGWSDLETTGAPGRRGEHWIMLTAVRRG